MNVTEEGRQGGLRSFMLLDVCTCACVLLQFRRWLPLRALLSTPTWSRRNRARACSCPHSSWKTGRRNRRQSIRQWGSSGRLGSSATWARSRGISTFSASTCCAWQSATIFRLLVAWPSGCCWFWCWPWIFWVWAAWGICARLSRSTSSNIACYPYLGISASGRRQVSSPYLWHSQIIYSQLNCHIAIITAPTWPKLVACFCCCCRIALHTAPTLQSLYSAENLTSMRCSCAQQQLIPRFQFRLQPCLTLWIWMLKLCWVFSFPLQNTNFAESSQIQFTVAAPWNLSGSVIEPNTLLALLERSLLEAQRMISCSEVKLLAPRAVLDS